MKIPRLVLIGGKLAIICTVAAVVLGLINAMTAPVIVANREKALADGLAAIASEAGIPGPRVGEPLDVSGAGSATAAYPISGSDGSLAGFVVQLTGTGYGGDMQLLAGYYPSGELFSAQLMENQETPGLGKKAESAQYMEMFLGSGGGSAIPVSKSDLPAGVADSITGATITFIGVARALAEGSDVAQQQTTAGGAQ